MLESVLWWHKKMLFVHLGAYRIVPLSNGYGAVWLLVIFIIAKIIIKKLSLILK